MKNGDDKLVHDLGWLEEIAHNALRVVLANLDDKTRTGGYFCFIGWGPALKAVFAVGRVADAEKRRQYIAFCQEKCWRLAERPNDISSWETRDEPAERYGGGIRVGGTDPYAASAGWFAFSGLPEHADEALVLLMLLKLRSHAVEKAFAIATISGNELYRTITGRLAARGCWHNGDWTVPEAW